ncbi:ISAzo13-like element transposase-related protein [Solihabitans fulvus]|uniref:ISAzo13-like element transposase-related protein n=1 Tax=Solihabitans fulvus TaxID=1892852 RepID=UPI001CB764BD|nr:hypothetical protein [Solihabitans fulvus]
MPPDVGHQAQKKEPIGDFARPGRTWRPKGEPITAPDHDFLDPGAPVAIPYGTYDLGRDYGWVNVGTDRNTAAFAVESLRRCWNAQGSLDYPGVDRLLVTADSGGRTAADQLRGAAADHLGDPHQHRTDRQRHAGREHCPTGRILIKTERATVMQRVERHAFHGEWNYTIAPI